MMAEVLVIFQERDIRGAILPEKVCRPKFSRSVEAVDPV